LLDDLAEQGFRSVILSVGYGRDAIIEHFGARYGMLAIRYAVEEEQLGTGGAIRRALSLAAVDPVWALNGDSILRLGYRSILRDRERDGSRRAMTIALARVQNGIRYGRVRLEGTRIVGFEASGHRSADMINGGVYLMRSSLFDGMDLPRVFSFEEDF